MIGWSCYRQQVSLYERGRPLHVPLCLWHCDQGFQVMHAGLVAEHGAGVLFPGMGGSGKSTTCLSCLEAGLQFLGDDFIALSQDADDIFIGHSLFGSAHLEPEHLLRFKTLRHPPSPAPSRRCARNDIVLPRCRMMLRLSDQRSPASHPPRALRRFSACCAPLPRHTSLRPRAATARSHPPPNGMSLRSVPGGIRGDSACENRRGGWRVGGGAQGMPERLGEPRGYAAASRWSALVSWNLSNSVLLQM